MPSSTSNIMQLLKADHREVDELFAAFEDADGNAIKQAQIASKIGSALSVHAEIEETLFYPAVLMQLDEEGADLTCEATVEHGTLRGLISSMNGADASQPMVRAHVTVLKEYVQHHVKEEENELFPKCEKLDLDFEAMGVEMLELKQRMQEMVSVTPARGSTITIADVSARELAEA